MKDLPHGVGFIMVKDLSWRVPWNFYIQAILSEDNHQASSENENSYVLT